MADIHLFHPEHSDFVNGKTSKLPRTKPWILWLLWGVPSIMLIIAITSTVFAIQTWTLWNDLKTNGLVTKGIITKSDRDNRTDAHSYMYTFTVQGRKYLGECRSKNITPSDNGQEMRAGDQTTILYLPKHPEQSRLERDSSWPLGSTISVLVPYSIKAVIKNKKP